MPVRQPRNFCKQQCRSSISWTLGNAFCKQRSLHCKPERRSHMTCACTRDGACISLPRSHAASVIARAARRLQTHYMHTPKPRARAVGNAAFRR